LIAVNALSLAALAATVPSAPSLAPGSDTGSDNTDGITKIALPTLVGTCATGETVTLRVDGAAAAEGLCSAGAYSIALTSALSDGGHAIVAIARNHGVDSAPSAALQIVVDTVAPIAGVSCSPPAVTGNSLATLCIDASDGATGSSLDFLECALDAAPFSACQGPVVVGPLAPGAHTYSGRGTDLAGNVSSVVSYAFTVTADSTPEPYAFAPAVDAVPLSVVTSVPVTLWGMNAPAAVSVENGLYSLGCAESTFTSAPGTAVNGDMVCVRHTAGAAYTTATTTLTVGGVGASFQSFASEVAASPQVVDFAGVPIGGNATRALTIANNIASPVAIDAVTASAHFSATHACATLAAGASCQVTIEFTPPGLGLFTGVVQVATPAGTRAVPLRGYGGSLPALVTHYYQAILRRPPDAMGQLFWESEAARAQALGASVSEAFYSMAISFFNSPEYLAFNRDDTDFITDLYNAFFVRAPDSGGLAYWVGQLAAGMPREVALVEFLFSPEFKMFMQVTLGDVPARAEVNMLMDFYRGILSRMPDDDGFRFWLARFRGAQCLGASALKARIEEISSAFTLSPEYLQRSRTDPQYVGDLYNAFLRRGGDLGGVLYWIGRISGGSLTREAERIEFRNSVEFKARVNAAIAQGCLPP